MLEIKAITYNDLAPVVPIAGLVGQDGGTIGRGQDNAIVLPDPMRLISRQHLQVAPNGSGGWRLVNISSANLVYVNAAEIKSGQSCPLNVGDKVYIGGYVLQIRQADENAAALPQPALAESAPFAKGAATDAESASLLQDPQEPTDDFIAALVGEGGALPLGAAEALPDAGSLAEDPLDAFLAPPDARQSSDPMQMLRAGGIELRDIAGKGDALINRHDGIDRTAELLQEEGGSPMPDLFGSTSVDPLALFGGGGDILKDLANHPSSPRSTTAGGHDASDAGLADLFKVPEPLRPAAAPAAVVPPAEPAQPPAADDFDAYLEDLDNLIPPASQPMVEPQPADPLQALLGKANPSSVAAAGGANPLSVGGPRAQEAPSQRTLDVFPAAPAGLAATHAQDVPHTQPQSGVAAGPVTAAMAPDTPPMPLPQEPIAQPVATSQPGVQPSLPTGADVLYQALLQGLGLKEIPDRKGLDADFMRLLGQLLRCTSQGTVDLMAGRAVVKREVKANVTLIAPERNNPLKFSPDGEVALMYLLGRTYPGFMEPAEAMHNAYLDLRAHQMGLVSGMRSALNHVLDKFDPQVIDDEVPEKRALGLAMARKARLWDAYRNYFLTTRDEAQDRFQEFFGAAFLKAYEEATQSLNAQQPATPGGR